MGSGTGLAAHSECLRPRAADSGKVWGTTKSPTHVIGEAVIGRFVCDLAEARSLLVTALSSEDQGEMNG